MVIIEAVLVEITQELWYIRVVRLYQDLAIASWKTRPLYSDVSHRRFCISLFNGNTIA